MPYVPPPICKMKGKKWPRIIVPPPIQQLFFIIKVRRGIAHGPARQHTWMLFAYPTAGEVMFEGFAEDYGDEIQISVSHHPTLNKINLQITMYWMFEPHNGQFYIPEAASLDERPIYAKNLIDDHEDSDSDMLGRMIESTLR